MLNRVLHSVHVYQLAYVTIICKYSQKYHAILSLKLTQRADAIGDSDTYSIFDAPIHTGRDLDFPCTYHLNKGEL